MNSKLLFLVLLPVCAASIADNQKFHPLEKYCVTRASSGMMVGNSVECSCEWGRIRYEHQDLAISVGGVEIPNKQHIIQIESEITTYNPDTRQGTVSQNEMYDVFANSDAADDPMAAMRSSMEAMGSTFTGETKQVAGHDCQIVKNSAIGDMCISDDGLVLEMVVMEGTMTQVATSVDLGTCGDENNYIVPDDITLSDTPDLSEMMEQLQNIEGLQSE